MHLIIFTVMIIITNYNYNDIDYLMVIIDIHIIFKSLLLSVFFMIILLIE